MSVPVVLGFDPSKTKIGWGAVADADGAPLWAGYAPCDGSPEGVHRAMADVAGVLRGHGWSPTFALVEYPFGGRGGGHGIFESGVAVGYCEAYARLLWPWLPLDRIGAIHWRPKVGVPRAPAGLTDGRRRDWLKAADVDLALQLGFDLPMVGSRKRRPSDDAADGALIARTAWLALESKAPGSPRRIPSPERTAA